MSGVPYVRAAAVTVYYGCGKLLLPPIKLSLWLQIQLHRPGNPVIKRKRVKEKVFFLGRDNDCKEKLLKRRIGGMQQIAHTV